MNSIEELSEYIAEKLAGEYDYETHQEAIADITKAAFDLASSKLGASGWTASGAELLFLAKSRRIDGPFALIKAEDMMYPQYWDRIPEMYLDRWMPWAGKQAKKRLSEHSDGKNSASARVIAHWQWLAEQSAD